MSVCKIIKKTKQCPPSSPRLKRYTADVDGFDVRRHVYLASDVEALLSSPALRDKLAMEVNAILAHSAGVEDHFDRLIEPWLKYCFEAADRILALIGGTP